MAAKTDKKADAQHRARQLADELAALSGMVERQWAIKAGVSASFFSNLRGTPTKPPSEPSIGNLRLILQAAGSTIPEFFIAEANGRVVQRPTRRALERALQDALPGLPKAHDRRAEYLAQVVQRALELPADTLDDQATDDQSDPADHEADALARRSTN